MELDFSNKELYEIPLELECKNIISESISMIYDVYNFWAHLCFLK